MAGGEDGGPRSHQLRSGLALLNNLGSLTAWSTHPHACMQNKAAELSYACHAFIPPLDTCSRHEQGCGLDSYVQGELAMAEAT